MKRIYLAKGNSFRIRHSAKFRKGLKTIKYSLSTMKKAVSMLVLVLLLTSMLIAQTDEQTCGFWCKVAKFIGGDSSKRALVA